MPRVSSAASAVRQETSAFDLVDQIEGRRRVVNMPAGQGVSDDHARSVDAQMKRLPAAYTASAMFHGRPFTFTHSREPGTVDDEMYDLRGPRGGGEVQGRGADHAVRESCDRARTGRGTASRRSTAESPPSDEGAGERSGGASARFRWQPRSTAAALRACRRPRPPTWRSLPASTTGDVASLDPCSVVRRPVSDAVFRFVPGMHSRRHVESMPLRPVTMARAATTLVFRAPTLQQARHGGAMDQGRQAGHPLDAAVVPSFPGRTKCACN